MHNKYFCSNYPNYILCHIENSITSILCFKLNEIVQDIAAVVVVMLNKIGYFIISFFLIEAQLLYNAMLVSGVEHSDSVILGWPKSSFGFFGNILRKHLTYIYILFQILFCYRLLQNIEYSSLCYTKTKLALMK